MSIKLPTDTKCHCVFRKKKMSLAILLHVISKQLLLKLKKYVFHHSV